MAPPGAVLCRMRNAGAMGGLLHDGEPWLAVCRESQHSARESLSQMPPPPRIGAPDGLKRGKTEKGKRNPSHLGWHRTRPSSRFQRIKTQLHLGKRQSSIDFLSLFFICGISFEREEISLSERDKCDESPPAGRCRKRALSPGIQNLVQAVGDRSFQAVGAELQRAWVSRRIGVPCCPMTSKACPLVSRRTVG